MSASPNVLAYLALILWIPASLALFAFFRPPRAALMTVLGAMLLLPVRVAFDAPGMPALGKQEIGNLCVLLGILFFARHEFSIRGLGRGMDGFILVLIAGAAATAYTNGDTVPAGPLTLPALGMWDALSMSMQQFLLFGIPFVAGRMLFSRARDLSLPLLLVAAAALVYSLPILFEARMSPSLHRIVYGFNQHFFHQSIRLGGYRPMVFMDHGLELALFVLIGTLASVALGRTGARIGPFPARAVGVFLALVLVLCRSMGALVYGLFLVPLMTFLDARWQMRVASALALLVLLYPLARMSGVFPVQGLVGIARSVNDERADSLAFRFDNEDRLLAKAIERPWFGWGSYNRNRTFDLRTGEPDSITDGYWILQLGSAGMFGFLGSFGLLLFPIWNAHRRFAKIRSRRDRLLIAGLSLMLTTYAVDLLPNAFLVPLTVFLAGALTGLVSAAISRPRVSAPRRPAGGAPAGKPQSAGEAKPRPPSLRDLIRPRIGHGLDVAWRRLGDGV